MSKISRQLLKDRFKTGARPTQDDFRDLIDSQFHALEDGLTLDSITKNLGIGVADPKEKLHVGGAITIGDTVNIIPDQGTIKFDGSKFWGYNGTWVDLGASGGDTFWEKPTAGTDLISFDKNAEGVEIKIDQNLPSLSIKAINGSNDPEVFTFLADGLSEAIRFKGKRFWFSKQDELSNLFEVNTEDEEIKMTTASGEMLNCRDDRVYIPKLIVDDLTATTSWTPPPSDIRLKKNIVPFSAGLSVIRNLNPVTFEYNGLAGTKVGHAHVGLIAQELQKVLPNMVEVHERKLHEHDEILTELLYPKSHELVYLAINAIKELQQKIEQLEKQVSNLQYSSNGNESK